LGVCTIVVIAIRILVVQIIAVVLLLLDEDEASKFSASENAPKNLENVSLCQHFLRPEIKGKYEICSKFFKSKKS